MVLLWHNFYVLTNLSFQKGKNNFFLTEFSLKLFQSFLWRTKFNRNVLEVEVRLNKVDIPVQETTYWCHIQKLDDFIQQKHHIVQFEPLLSNPDIVHHMEVFHCETDADAQIPLYNGDCDKMPEEAKICNRVISLWAMGASAFTYPKEAGLPVGGTNYNPFIRLEVHFNNPELKSGKKNNKKKLMSSMFIQAIVSLKV